MQSKLSRYTFEFVTFETFFVFIIPGFRFSFTVTICCFQKKKFFARISNVISKLSALSTSQKGFETVLRLTWGSIKG